MYIFYLIGKFGDGALLVIYTQLDLTFDITTMIYHTMSFQIYQYADGNILARKQYYIYKIWNDL